MPGLCYQDPNNTANLYRTMFSTDPSIPAGYILQAGCDGAADRDQQTFHSGGASGGFPVYPAAPDKATVIANLQNLNGSQSPNASNSPY